MKRIILFLLSITIPILLLSGCNNQTVTTTDSNNIDQTSSENSSSNTTDIFYDKEIDELIPDLLEASRKEKIEIVAKTYVQDVTLSWRYNLKITFDNGHMFLGDILYDDVTISQNNEFILSQGIIANVESLPILKDENTYIETVNVLNKIKNQKKLYILRTSSSQVAYGNPVLVYYFDDTLYILAVHTGDYVSHESVLRIHSVNIGDLNYVETH